MECKPRKFEVFVINFVLNALFTSLIMVDSTEATCMCALNLTNRQFRDSYIHNYTETFINEFTENVTIKIQDISKSDYNLTKTMATFTGNRTLGQFAIMGGFANLLMAQTIVQAPENTSVRYPCGDTSVVFDTYLKDCYFKRSGNWIASLAKSLNFSIGVYRVGMFNYTYVSTDLALTTYPFCSCPNDAGFSYHIHFKINATNLPPLYYNGSTLIGKLTRRDIELAMDYICTNLLGEVFIHTKFNIWIDNITFCAHLHFKGNQYDVMWNDAKSNISQTLGNVTWLELNYQGMKLPIVSKPVIASCHLALGSNLSQACPTIPVIQNGTTGIISMVKNVTDLPTTVQEKVNETLDESVVTELAPEMDNVTTTQNVSVVLNNTSITALLNITVSSVLNSTLSYPLLIRNLTTGFINEATVGSTSIIVPNSVENTTQVSQNIPVGAYTSTPFNSSGSTTLSTSLAYSTTDLKSTTVNNYVSMGTAMPVSGVSVTPSFPFNVTPTKLTDKVKSTTPFDEDPFFKSQVPVIRKVYNDRELLRRMEGTIAPILQEGYFYTITIPTALGMIFLIVLCLACCHVDWTTCLAPKKEGP